MNKPAELEQLYLTRSTHIKLTGEQDLVANAGSLPAAVATRLPARVAAFRTAAKRRRQNLVSHWLQRHLERRYWPPKRTYTQSGLIEETSSQEAVSFCSHAFFAGRPQDRKIVLL